MSTNTPSNPEDDVPLSTATEEELDDDTEHDTFYRSYHNLSDPRSNDSGATGTTISNRPEIHNDSDPCGNCNSPSSLDCVCRDMRYCSPQCQVAHEPQHEAICYAFRTQAPRPSNLHYCGILLPQNSRDLRFVWIVSQPELSNFGLSELTPLTRIPAVEDSTNGRWSGKNGHLDIIGWQQDQKNQSLANLLGWESKVWRGTVLVRAFVEQELEPLELENDRTIQLTTIPAPVDAGTKDVEGFLRYCHLFRRDID